MNRIKNMIFYGMAAIIFSQNPIKGNKLFSLIECIAAGISVIVVFYNYIIDDDNTEPSEEDANDCCD